MAAGRGLFVVGEDYAERCREAMEKAGRFLSVRARTEQETRERLSTMGFEAGVVDQTTTRLIELGLLDDLEFAKQWVGERSQRKSLGPRALRAELVAKGVPSEVIDQAIAEVGPEGRSLPPAGTGSQAPTDAASQGLLVRGSRGGDQSGPSAGGLGLVP